MRSKNKLENQIQYLEYSSELFKQTSFEVQSDQGTILNGWQIIKLLQQYLQYKGLGKKSLACFSLKFL